MCVTDVVSHQAFLFISSMSRISVYVTDDVTDTASTSAHRRDDASVPLSKALQSCSDHLLYVGVSVWSKVVHYAVASFIKTTVARRREDLIKRIFLYFHSYFFRSVPCFYNYRLIICIISGHWRSFLLEIYIYFLNFALKLLIIEQLAQWLTICTLNTRKKQSRQITSNLSLPHLLAVNHQGRKD